MKISRETITYLEDIVDCIERIQLYRIRKTKLTFINDQFTQDAVSLRLLMIGELAKKLPEGLRLEEPDVPWDKIITIRNMIAHDDIQLDAAWMWELAEHDLPVLRLAAFRLLKKLKQN